MVKGSELVKTSANSSTSVSTEPAVDSLEHKSHDDQPGILLQDLVGAATLQSSESRCSKPSSRDGLNTGRLSWTSVPDALLTSVHADRRILRRCNSVPASPTSPTTGASSDTLYNTPHSSDTSASPALSRFRQAVDAHRGFSKTCQKALIEHLKSEETEKKNTDWAALVEWTKIGNTTEVEKMRKERSEVRRRLEMQSRELRAMKREMKLLKKSLEAKSQLDNESEAETVDEDEGGVLLPHTLAAPTANVQEVQEDTCDTPQETEKADHGISVVNESTNKAKTSRKEMAEERKELQRALKQQLMEDSVPAAPENSEAGYSTAKGVFEQDSSSKAVCNKSYNKARFAKVEDLQHHNEGLQNVLEHTRGVIYQLQTEAELKDEEINKLKAENHFAQLEVGHCNAANACYRAAMEDGNPALTAHLDGLLKRKEEAYAELEMRAAECAELLAEEKKHGAIEKVYSYKNIQGLENELAHRLNVIDALTEGKAVLKEQNDKVYEMFEGKICQNDAIKVFLHDWYAIRKDNALLIKMVNERQGYMLDAEKAVAELQAEKIIDEHAANTDKVEYRQLQQALNGLTYVNHQLNAKIDFQDEIREELRTELEGQLKQQATEVQHLLQWGANDWLERRQQAQERQIVSQNQEITKLNSLANHWRIRAMEQQDDFCPMANWEEVTDWNAEDARWRLWDAERKVEQLQRERRQLIREGKRPEVREVGHDGSNWLRDRAEATRVMEEFVDFEG